jgi:hypothetical protein
MRRPTSPPSPSPRPILRSGDVTTEQLKATVEAAVGPVKSELRWQRWLLFALVAAVFSPKLGGRPPRPPRRSLDPNVAPQAVQLARAFLGI